MDKPFQKFFHQPCYHWHEIADYLKDKHGIDVRAFNKDFWVDHIFADNETYFYLSLNPEDYTFAWEKEIVQTIKEEFFDETTFFAEFYVDW